MRSTTPASNCKHTTRFAYCRGMCKSCYNYVVRNHSPETSRRRNATPAAKERKRRWRQAHPNHQKQHHRLKRYGISPEQYDEMLRTQNNACKVCLTNFTTTKRCCIDHDHTTGKVRGLLCSSCNAGLGMVRDSEFRLARLIAYLRWSGSLPAHSSLEAWALADFVDLRPPHPLSTSSKSSPPG